MSKEQETKTINTWLELKKESDKTYEEIREIIALVKK